MPGRNLPDFDRPEKKNRLRLDIQPRERPERGALHPLLRGLQRRAENTIYAERRTQ
jgi:hypothetical protein